MSCVIVPVNSADCILDIAAVARIQTALASVSWLEAVYNIAEVAEQKTSDGGIERFPRVYKNLSSTPKEYYDVRYNDELKAQVFFERDAPIEFGIDGEFDQVRYSLSLVCWANLNKVDSTRTDNFTSLLAGNILKVLRDNFLAEMEDNITMELRAEEVYSKYTFTDVENRFITLPYTAFKISFNWVEFHSGSCFTFTSQGSNPC